jgi:hypothetical protein
VADDQWYTREEMEAMLRKMEAASLQFYEAARRTGCHPFIEFTGFMNEYIKICRDSLNQGVEFPRSNTHTGLALPMKPHQAEYIAEKFDCIFGPSFRTHPQLKQIFDRHLMGHVEVEKAVPRPTRGSRHSVRRKRRSGTAPGSGAGGQPCP